RPRREQVGRLEEDGRAIAEAPGRPVAPRFPSRLDCRRDFFRAGLMHFREHVPVAMRHHGIDGLAGADFLAADDDGNLHLVAAEVFQCLLELGALAGAWRVRENRLVDRCWNLGCVHAGNVTGEPAHVLEVTWRSILAPESATFT